MNCYFLSLYAGGNICTHLQRILGKQKYWKSCAIQKTGYTEEQHALWEGYESLPVLAPNCLSVAANFCLLIFLSCALQIVLTFSYVKVFSCYICSFMVVH